ncbi:MAG: PIN domain-containing protein [Candidatus Aenigmarchaeota archaeon]|nr:PIN domain-containing protein [Candidatus Aenigmarchaeota archaeon]
MEIIAGNPYYRKYTDAEIVLTKLNLFEIFYTFLKENLKKARFYLNKYRDFAIEFDAEIIESAGLLKKSNPRLSMADCIGYITALKNGIKFLTGDGEFENMPNVEFVR